MNIKKDIFYNLILTGSNLLFPLLTFPYLSRIIGPEGYGNTDFIFSYCQTYIIIAALGVSMYGSREIARIGDDKIKRSQLFFELLIIHLFITVCLTIIYFISVVSLDKFQNFKQLTFFGGLYILLNVFAVEWLYQGVSDFKYISIRSLIVRSLSVISIFIFVKHKDDFNLYFIIIVITFLFTVLFNLNYARKYINWHFDFSLKKIFSHSWPLFILGIYMVLNAITGQVAPTLLGFLSTTVAVGYYSAAFKIVMLILSGFYAITQVMFPNLNRLLVEKGNEEYNLFINKLLHIFICFGIPITFMVYLMAKPLVMLLGGRDYENSIICVRIMAPVIFIGTFAQIFVLLILTVNRKDKEIAIITIIGLVISILINVFFIPHFAEKAAAFSKLLVEFSKTAVAFYMVMKVLDIKIPGKLLLQNIVFVIPFFFFSYFWIKTTDNYLLELLMSSIFCGLYFLFYQFVFIKDQYLLNLINPYLQKLLYLRNVSKRSK